MDLLGLPLAGSPIPFEPRSRRAGDERRSSTILVAERRGSFAARQASHPAPAARHRKALRRALRARRPALTALLGFLGWSVPLSAHDFWIEPSSFRVAGGEPITLSLRVGEAFHGEPVPRDPAHARRFAVLGPAGETSVLGRPGSHPAGFLPPLAPGTYVAVYGSAASELELDGAHFEQYLREEGLEAVAAERAARGQTAAPARERFSRCAKALVTVGEGEGVAAGFDRVAGLRLELFTEADPRRGPHRCRGQGPVAPEAGRGVAAQVRPHAPRTGQLGRRLGEPVGVADVRGRGGLSDASVRCPAAQRG
jgi:hypothetical protein